MIIPDVEGVGRDEVVPFQDLHVVDLESRAQSIRGPRYDPIADEAGRAEQEQIAEL